jgi:multiple antibiotic resistance protein
VFRYPADYRTTGLYRPAVQRLPVQGLPGYAAKRSGTVQREIYFPVAGFSRNPDSYRDAKIITTRLRSFAALRESNLKSLTTLPSGQGTIFAKTTPMDINFNNLLTVTFTLFAVIDIVGSVPILISLKQKMGGINELRATLISGALMIVFMFVGESFLGILGLDTGSFAVGGSIVIFILGLEMVLGLELFKSEKDVKNMTVVPIAFPLIAGSGTLTTIMSLRGAHYGETIILIAILINLVIVYIVLKSLGGIARLLGPAGLIAVRKFFGVILLAIAVKIFATNAPGLIK